MTATTAATSHQMDPNWRADRSLRGEGDLSPKTEELLLLHFQQPCLSDLASATRAAALRIALPLQSQLAAGSRLDWDLELDRLDRLGFWLKRMDLDLVLVRQGDKPHLHVEFAPGIHDSQLVLSLRIQSWVVHRDGRLIQTIDMSAPGASPGEIGMKSDRRRFKKARIRRVITVADVNDQGLESMRQFPSLELLALNHTEFSDAGVHHLTCLRGLETLWLHHTRIYDGGLEQLAQLPQLRQLELANTSVTAAGVADFETRASRGARPLLKRRSDP